MKKLIVILLFICFVFGCKNETCQKECCKTESTQPVEKAVVSQSIIPPYYGMGTFDINGNVNYLVSLPKSVQNDIKIEKIFRVGNTIIVQITTTDNIELSNPNDEIIQLKFKIPLNQNDKKLTMKLWHDDKPINNETDAERVIDNNCPKSGYMIPQKCGNGVLTAI